MTQKPLDVNIPGNTASSNNVHESGTIKQSNNSPIVTHNSTDIEIVKDSATSAIANEAPALGTPEFVKAVQKTVDDLRKLNKPALPVAPPHDKPKWDSVKKAHARDCNGNIEYQFNGQVPSYIRKGIHQTVSHITYKSKLPNEAKLKEWFKDSRVGIGTIINGEFVTLYPTPNYTYTLETEAPALVSTEIEPKTNPNDTQRRAHSRNQARNRSARDRSDRRRTGNQPHDRWQSAHSQKRI